MELFRTAGILDMEIINSSKLLFLGTGSLGSLTIANLAYPWRGIVLVDPDNLEEENIERHLLGKPFIGQPKVEGIAQWLTDKGIKPEKITCHSTEAQKVLSQHTDANVAIVSIDNQIALHSINDWCTDNSIPALYGGIYPLGTGGEVIVITNPNDICYRCAAKTMGRSLYKGFTSNYGLGTATPIEEKVQVVPILHWAINSIAADMADLTLEILSEGKPPPQVLIHAHNNWEPILELDQGPTLNALTGYVVSQFDIGLVANLKLEKVERSYRLRANRSVFSLLLSRWDTCPNHEETFSLEEL